MNVRLWSLVLCAACVAPVVAEDDLEALFDAVGEENFLTIATGQKQLISQAPAVATVITAEQIVAMGARSLDEVLETVPGIHVSLSSTYLSPIYSIRGIRTDKNPQVLMLLNGIPLTRLHFGDRGSRNSLPIHDIARVEVIRGPGSAIYGADAFAGVINVITKGGAEIDGTEIGAGYGSFDTREFWLLHGAERGELRYSVSLQAMQTDGDASRIVGSDAQSVFDASIAPLAAQFALPLQPASLAPGPLETGEERLDLRVQLDYRDLTLRAWNWRGDDYGVGPGLALALDPRGSADADNYLVDVAWGRDLDGAASKLELHASWMDVETTTRQRLFPAGAVLPIGADGNLNTDPLASLPMVFVDGMIGNPEFYEEHWRLDAVLTHSGFVNHQLRLAAGTSYQEETARESKNYGPGVLDLASRDPACFQPFCVVGGAVTDVSGTSNVFMNDQDRTLWYLSVQDQWRVAPDWDLTLGLRYDRYSDFGTTLNPRLALVWNTAQNLTSKLLYGRAFRAPSFAELFVINNPVALGNEELEPEVINTVELAFDYRPGFDLRTGFNLFWYEVEDLIEFVPTAGGLVASNVGEQRGYGVELEADWQPHPDLKLHANYAWQNSDDQLSDSDVADTPAHQAYLRAIWRLPNRWTLQGDWRWIADRSRATGDPRPAIDDYHWANLSVGYGALQGRLDLRLHVRNVFDENAREPVPAAAVPGGSLIPGDFPLEERHARLSVSYRF